MKALVLRDLLFLEADDLAESPNGEITLWVHKGGFAGLPPSAGMVGAGSTLIACR